MMTKQQKKMLEDALEALMTSWDGDGKKLYIAASDYAMAKIEDVLALEEGEEPEERPITAEDILGIGAKK